MVALASYSAGLIRSLMGPDEIDTNNESFCVDFYLTMPDAQLQKLSKNLSVRPILNRVEPFNEVGAQREIQIFELPENSIDNYTLIKQVGHGGQSRVILAR